MRVAAMITYQGIYLPDHERHLQQWMDRSGEIVDGKGTYQIKKLRKAVSYCEQKRTAVDIGAHVGFWSMQLAKEFKQVISFEPVSAHRECFLMNLATCENVELVACALGEKKAFVRIDIEVGSSGHSEIGETREYQPSTFNLNSEIQSEAKIPLKTLDSFKLDEVDFIKLDCEGYELHSLIGGIETIKRNRPVIIVEQKPGRAARFGLPDIGAVQWLAELDYIQKDNMSGDYIMVPG